MSKETANGKRKATDSDEDSMGEVDDNIPCMGDEGYVFYLHQTLYRQYIIGTTAEERQRWVRRHASAANKSPLMAPMGTALPMQELIRIHKLLDEEYPSAKSTKKTRSVELGSFNQMVAAAYEGQIAGEVMRHALPLASLMAMSTDPVKMFGTFSDCVEAHLNTAARFQAAQYDNSNEEAKPAFELGFGMPPDENHRSPPSVLQTNSKVVGFHYGRLF